MMSRRQLLIRFLNAIRRDGIQQAESLVRGFTDKGEVWSAALLVRQGSFEFVRGFGKAGPDAVFLLASITKPMTAAGVMILRDRGELKLDDAVRKFLPQFSGGDRDLITIRHLLTHTSGLPDMLPENVELRKRHAPLGDFVAATCKTPLLFKPGAEVRYQSMGILLASAIAERVTGQPFRDFLRQQVFVPLRMTRTSLGLGGRRIADTQRCQVPEETDWDWNTLYWRDLGAPWGGAHANVRDVDRFLSAFQKPESPILEWGTTLEMIANQTAPLRKPWGIGWMVEPGSFGRHCSPSTFGHWGSTGTVAWRDRDTNTHCVLLTTKPAANSRDGLLGPVCDLVSRAAQPA
jgi:CubicO group peptidase (beta-lactamase class C family)